MRSVDVVPKAPGFNFDVLVLNPIERGEMSKAGIYDETLILDDSRAPWLGELLSELAATSQPAECGKHSAEGEVGFGLQLQDLQQARRMQQIVNQHGERLTVFGEHVRSHFVQWKRILKKLKTLQGRSS